MALELFGKVALGTVFGELWKAFREVKDKIKMFKPRMEQLGATLISLGHAIQQIEFYNYQLNLPLSEIEWRLIGVMREGKKLLLECSTIGRRNYWKQWFYHDKLKKLDDRLVRLLNIDLQAQIVSDLRLILLGVNDIIMTLNHGLGRPNLTVNVQSERIKVALKFDLPESPSEYSRVMNLIASEWGGDSMGKWQGEEKWNAIVMGSSDAEKLVDMVHKHVNGHVEILQVTSTTNHNEAEEGNQLNASDQNSQRISEYDEMSENPLSEGGNHRHIEWLAHPSPPPANETSAENHEEENEKMVTHGESGRHGDENVPIVESVPRQGATPISNDLIDLIEAFTLDAGGASLLMAPIREEPYKDPINFTMLAILNEQKAKEMAIRVGIALSSVTRPHSLPKEKLVSGLTNDDKTVNIAKVVRNLSELCGFDIERSLLLSDAFHKFPNLMFIRPDSTKSYLKNRYTSLVDLLGLLNSTYYNNLTVNSWRQINSVLEEVETWEFDPEFILEIRAKLAYALEEFCLRAHGIAEKIKAAKDTIVRLESELNVNIDQINRICDVIEKNGSSV